MTLAADLLALLAPALVTSDVYHPDSLALLVAQAQAIDELGDLTANLLGELSSRDEDKSASAAHLSAVSALEDALDDRDGVGQRLA